MSLLVKINLILVSVFTLALLPAGLLSYRLLTRNAREQVIQNARLMMQTALAMRGYTNKQVSPLLRARSTAEEFLPQTVPAYSATEIFNSLRESHPEYSYKEATLNPTNPRDRTVDWEADVVTVFRNDAKAKEFIGERDTPQGRSLFLGRPIRITDANCLSCHTTAETAPPAMVKIYGTGNGFGWKMNEVIGAQIVSVPMELPIRMAGTAFRALVLSLVAVFAVTLVVLNVLLAAIVVRPIKQLAKMSDEVSLGNLDVPDVKVKGKDEVAALAGSLHRMRISMQKALKMLEEGGE